MEEITIGQLLQTPEYIATVEKLIKDTVKNRESRPQPKPGYRYKRDWYDQMNDDNCLSAKFFIEAIPKIWDRTSSLSSVKRRIIKPICEYAVVLTMNQYKEAEKESVSPVDKVD